MYTNRFKFGIDRILSLYYFYFKKYPLCLDNFIFNFLREKIFVLKDFFKLRKRILIQKKISNNYKLRFWSIS
jgi:hypothetical protein